MYCRNCGNKIRSDEKFCPRCGSPVLRQQGIVGDRKQGKNHREGIKNICLFGIIVVLILFLILQNLSILPILSGRETYITKDTGCDTPEKTAEAFVEAVADGNIEKALSFFACNQMADNYRFEYQIDRLLVWIPGGFCSYPSEEKVFREINKGELYGEAVSQIGNLCFSLQAYEEYMSRVPISLEDDENIVEKMREFCDLKALETLRIKEIEYAGPDTQSEEVYDKAARIYGADERVEYEILYEYDGEMFKGGMTFLRYEEKWYIESLIAASTGQNALGYLIPAESEE